MCFRCRSFVASVMGCRAKASAAWPCDECAADGTTEVSKEADAPLHFLVALARELCWPLVALIFSAGYVAARVWGRQ